MLKCKSYLHAVYLLGFNKVYIKYYAKGKEIKEGKFISDEIQQERNMGSKFDGTLYVIREDGIKEEINYFTIINFEIDEVMGKPKVKYNQDKLKEMSMELMTDNIGINKNINLSMDEVSNILDSKLVEIEFIKVDGNLRKMLGTINDWRLGDDPKKEYFMGVDKDKERYGNMVVYDLEKHEYRTLRYLSIISINKVNK